MMQPNLPVLPPYVRWHESPSGDIYYRFECSTRMRLDNFPIHYMSLGTRFDEAMKKYDEIIRPILEAYKESRTAMLVENGVVYGSLRWFGERWQEKGRWRALSKRSKQTYKDGILRLCNHVIRGGRFAGSLFGDLPMSVVTEGLADDVYEEYVFRTDEDGNVTGIERTGTAKHDFETARAMINVLRRRFGHLLFKDKNVFEGMDMAHRQVGRAAVTLPQLGKFVRGADAKGLFSISGIVLYAFEMFGRVENFPSKVTVEYFRPPDRKDEIQVVQEKTHQGSWFDLYSDSGKMLYPAMTKRLAKLKGRRKEGTLFPCERAEPGKIRPWRKAELSAVIKEICKSVGLPPLVLNQFRKGGLTESGSAGLTTSQIMAQSLHLVESTVQIYIEKNKEVAAGGQAKRLVYRKRKARFGTDIVT
jgi:hypothetical protein